MSADQSAPQPFAWIAEGRAEPPEPLGRPVVLNALWWDGPAPAPGDCLGTQRRRHSYQIIDVKPRRTGGYRLKCNRIRLGTEPGGVRYWLWTWAPRARQARRLGDTRHAVHL